MSTDEVDLDCPIHKLNQKAEERQKQLQGAYDRGYRDGKESSEAYLEGIRLGFEAARARSTRRVRNMIDIDVGNKFKTVEDFLKSTDKGGK